MKNKIWAAYGLSLITLLSIISFVPSSVAHHGGGDTGGNPLSLSETMQFIIIFVVIIAVIGGILYLIGRKMEKRKH